MTFYSRCVVTTLPGEKLQSPTLTESRAEQQEQPIQTHRTFKYSQTGQSHREGGGEKERKDEKGRREEMGKREREGQRGEESGETRHDSGFDSVHDSE